MPIPESKPANPCADCVIPCAENDGECTGPLTEEEQRALNDFIVYEHQDKPQDQEAEA